MQKSKIMIRSTIGLLLLIAGFPVLAGELDVNPLARFKGDFGLEVTVDGTPTFLRDERPDDEQDVRARFYIRTTDISLQEGDGFQVLAGTDTGGLVWFRVSVNRTGGELKLQIEARLDNGTFTGLTQGQQPVLTNGWHAVEVQWLANAGGGQLLGFLDGAALPGITGLTNGAGSIADVLFGSVTGTSGSSGGTALLDDYDSRRDTTIGQLCLTQNEIDQFNPDWPQLSVLRLVEYQVHRCP